MMLKRNYRILSEKERPQACSGKENEEGGFRHRSKKTNLRIPRTCSHSKNTIRGSKHA